MNYINTAPGYGNSEEASAWDWKALQPADYLHQAGRAPHPFNPKDKAALHASVKESLRLLHREYIDMLLIHEPDRPGQWGLVG